MLVNKDLPRGWTEEIRKVRVIKDRGTEYDDKPRCPVCGGSPAIKEQTVYHGRSNHRGACCLYTLKNIICTECGLQTGQMLCEEQYDDSDTIYPSKVYVSDSAVWNEWIKLTKIGT